MCLASTIFDIIIVMKLLKVDSVSVHEWRVRMEVVLAGWMILHFLSNPQPWPRVPIPIEGVTRDWPIYLLTLTDLSQPKHGAAQPGTLRSHVLAHTWHCTLGSAWNHSSFRLFCENHMSFISDKYSSPASKVYSRGPCNFVASLFTIIYASILYLLRLE